MKYEESFTTVNHAFLISPKYTIKEKIILIWLASKPEGWDVVLEVVCHELNLGRRSAENTLRDLRAKGAITKPDALRRPDGAYLKESGRLAIRDEIKGSLPRLNPIPVTDALGTDALGTDALGLGAIHKEGLRNDRPEVGPSVAASSAVASSSPIHPPMGSERSERYMTSPPPAKDHYCIKGCHVCKARSRMPA